MNSDDLQKAVGHGFKAEQHVLPVTLTDDRADKNGSIRQCSASAACCVAHVATVRRVSGWRCAGVAARAIRGSWRVARLALGRYGGQPWVSAGVQRRHALWMGRCRESAQRRWLSTSPREAALTRVSAYSAYAAWSRLAPLGQMTVTRMPRCRASVTTSAVPPYARAGSPSHTANKRSALSSMALLAAM